MKKLLMIVSCFLILSCNQADKVLVFTKTNAFRHSSIPTAVLALDSLSSDKFQFTFTEDSLDFNSGYLSQFDAIIFLNTSGDILGPQEQQALKSFLKGGKGFLGIHAAADTEHDWEWYGNLIGARFKSHPPICKATIDVNKEDPHPCCDHLNGSWSRVGEWYEFKDPPVPYANILLQLDNETNPDTLGTRPFPLAWYHDYDGVRMFYTALGHTEAAYTDIKFLKHIEGGLNWVLEN